MYTLHGQGLHQVNSHVKYFVPRGMDIMQAVRVFDPTNVTLDSAVDIDALVAAVSPLFEYRAEAKYVTIPRESVTARGCRRVTTQRERSLPSAQTPPGCRARVLLDAIHVQ